MIEFEFKLSKTFDYYSLISVKNISEEVVNIPRMYKGLPIKKISDYAFAIKRNSYIEQWDKLRKIIIPNTIEYIGKYAFMSCRYVETVEINLNSKLFEIDDKAFAQMQYLKVINIPKSVYRIGKSAFEDCYELSKVHFIESQNIDVENHSILNQLNINNENVSSIQVIDDYAFNNCFRLTEFELPNSVVKIGDFAFHLHSSESSILKKINISKLSNLQIIGKSNFRSPNLYIFIPKSTTFIGTNNFSRMYPKIQIDDENTSFKLNNHGTLVDLVNETLKFVPLNSNGDYIIPSGIKKLDDYIFTEDHCGIYYPQGKAKLVKIAIPNSVIEIGNFAFQYCDKLKNVEFEEDSQLEIIGESAFHIPPSTKVPKSIRIIGKNAFYTNSDDVTVNFEGIDNIEETLTVFRNWEYIPSRIKEIKKIYIETSKLVIPKLVKRIFENSFCVKVDTLLFHPECELDSLEKNAFINSTIKNIVLPNNIKNISVYAFNGLEVNIFLNEEKTEKNSFFNPKTYTWREDRGHGFDRDIYLIGGGDIKVYWKNEWKYDENDNPIVCDC